MATEEIHTYCRMCVAQCGVVAMVEDGRFTKVTPDSEHPNGGICIKGYAAPEIVYSPDRLRHPMKRTRPKGDPEPGWAQISWDEALDAIALRLQQIADTHGPESILPYSYAGTMGIVQGEAMAQRFFNRLGASKLDYTICASAGSAGHRLTLGPGVGVDVELVADARLIVFWGANAITSSVHFWARAQEAKRLGATLVAIDPYRSLTAEKCHLHIAPLPGTDAALALGLMHVLIRDDLLDHDYIERYTLGFEELKSRAAEYPPERVAKICSVSVAQTLPIAL